MGTLGDWLNYRKRSFDWGKVVNENLSFEIRDVFIGCRPSPTLTVGIKTRYTSTLPAGRAEPLDVTAVYDSKSVRVFFTD